MADNKKVPSWAWWLLIIMSLGIMTYGMITTNSGWETSPSGGIVKEYLLQPGQSEKISIPDQCWFKLDTDSDGIKIVDWRGKVYNLKNAQAWLGEEILNAKFTVTNTGHQAAKFVLVLRKK